MCDGENEVPKWPLGGGHGDEELKVCLLWHGSNPGTWQEVAKATEKFNKLKTY